MKPKHEDMFMRIAVAVALTSSATRAKVGAVIVKDGHCISTGYNGFPMHLNGPCELLNGTTDPRVRHAEKNALMGLTKTNESSIGATVFCTLSCCESCAHDMIDAGIKEFVYRDTYRDSTGLDLLKQAGVLVRQYKEST